VGLYLVELSVCIIPPIIYNLLPPWTYPVLGNHVNLLVLYFICVCFRSSMHHSSAIKLQDDDDDDDDDDDLEHHGDIKELADDFKVVVHGLHEVQWGHYEEQYICYQKDFIFYFFYPQLYQD